MDDPTKPAQTRGSGESDSAASRLSALYDRFAEKSREIFEQGQEKGVDAWEKAMDLARQQLSAAGEFSSEQGEAFKRYLIRDLHQTAEDMRNLGTEAKERLNPARLGAGALSTLARMLHAAGGAITALSNKAEETLLYKAGEVTMAGTLTCTACGHKILLKSTGIVPACPKCQGTGFRKSY